MKKTDRIVITGGAGLVGQNLIVHLKSRGYTDLVTIDKHLHNTRILQQLHPDIEVISADLSQPGDWEQAMEGGGALVMLHAQIGGLNKGAFIANNVTATRRVLEAAQARGVKHLVHISSSVVNSQAVDNYTETKESQEKLVLDCPIPHVILRPTLMFGWFDRKHLGWLARFMKRVPLYPVPGDGRYMRQPLYAKDFCNIIMACLATPPGETVYDISGLQKIHYIDMMRSIRKVTGARTAIIRVPYQLFWWLLRIYALFDSDPPFTTRQLEALTIVEEFPVIDWPGIFGVAPTALDQAFEETFNDPRYSSLVLEF
ncbi:MAG: NAD-dependent epimerase/dehydratase family protein [Gammaproteobacteria bacterium]|nr:NAD-dependent epimerase/dehydratase family protein [Gammaproteobacteria bacterium]